MREFNCTKCGLCCKLVSSDTLKMFNLPESPTGGCANLLPDNSCAIYESRPNVCRVKEGYEIYFADKMSWDEWVELNEKSCKQLEEIARDKL